MDNQRIEFLRKQIKKGNECSVDLLTTQETKEIIELTLLKERDKDFAIALYVKGLTITQIRDRQGYDLRTINKAVNNIYPNLCKTIKKVLMIE